MTITTFTLDDEQKLWLEQIILDKDQDEALKFLKDCIYRKIKVQEKSHLKTKF